MANLGRKESGEVLPLDSCSKESEPVTNKAFYKIGEVSRATGLKEYVIRFWESEFACLKPRKNSGGQRVYSKADLEIVQDIKRMLYEEGYTIAGAKKIFRNMRRFSDSINEVKKRDKIIQKVKKELIDILDAF